MADVETVKEYAMGGVFLAAIVVLLSIMSPGTMVITLVTFVLVFLVPAVIMFCKRSTEDE